MVGPPRLMRDSGDLDAWPVIADAFLAILCVVLFALMQTHPETTSAAERRRLLNSLRPELDRQVDIGDLQLAQVSEATVRLVYSAAKLSFKPCEWKIGAEAVELLQGHLRLFAPHAELVERIRIEGHADRDGVTNCDELKPYRDNLQLSQNRARAVLNVLLGLTSDATAGLDERLWGREVTPAPDGLGYLYELTKSGKVVVAGAGASTPINAAVPKDPANRRVELVISLK